MAEPKRDPWHTRPGDAGTEKQSYPQDEADAERRNKRRSLAWKAADVALDVLGEVVEGILDNI